MTAFLQIPVMVTFAPNIIDGVEENDDSMLLGNSRLGVTYIPSGKHMDGQRNWVVNIGPIPYGEMKKYINGSPFRKVLNAMYDYFLPVSVDIEENFITEKKPFHSLWKMMKEIQTDLDTLHSSENFNYIY